MTTINSLYIKALSSPINNSDNSIIRFKRGDDIYFRVAIFKDEETLASLDNILSLHFEIYDIGNYQSPSPRTFEVLLQKTVDAENINTALTLDDWNDEISQHATFEVAAEESTLEYGEKWLKISAKTDEYKYITLSAGWIEIEENFSTYENSSVEDVITWKNAAQESAEAAAASADSAQSALEDIQEEISQISSYTTSAQESAQAASSSASAAATSASSASSYSTSASNYANLSSSYATNASTSASSASSYSSSASSSATSASSSLASVNTLKDEIMGYSVSNTTSTSISVAIAANTTYTYGTLTSLTFSSVASSVYESKIFFSSGTTATTFSYPSTLKTIGDITISASKSYAISICNNIMVLGELN